MGTKCAPKYANIFMSTVDAKIKSSASSLTDTSLDPIKVQKRFKKPEIDPTNWKTFQSTLAQVRTDACHGFGEMLLSMDIERTEKKTKYLLNNCQCQE